MRNSAAPPTRLPGDTTFYALIVVWTLLVLASVLTQREQLDHTAAALARIDAVANLRKDMAIRKWASNVGGVFMREDRIPAAESLDEEERVSATRPDGTTLRLVAVTPIHLLLAIQQTSNREFGIRERLTSRQLRNIGNAPDEWETKALEALSRGSEMITEALPGKQGHGLMRVMLPMRMEEECLECHRDTLVPVGGLRGGATVSIDLNAYRAAQEPTWKAIQTWHLGIWILGLTGIAAFRFFNRRRVAELMSQEALRRENEAAFGAMAEGAIITRADGTILWINDAFCRISGYSRAEVIGQNPRLLKSGVHDAAFYAALWQQLTRDGHWRGELWNRRKSGEVFPEEISIQALRQPDGRIHRYISIFSDITERKKTENELQRYREGLEDLVRQRTEELTEARDQAEAANRSKTRFLANMSHELRTPLNAVIGFSRLMEKDPGLSPQQQRNIEIINSSGNHLLTLINDILELSKIEAGKMDLHREEVDLHELLRQVTAMMGLRAEQAGLQLVLETQDLPPTVILDPVMLRQVLLNLLSNAIKFTPAGNVCLHARGQALADGRRALLMAVTDTGIGIPSAEHQRIFRSFEQAGGSHQGGTGLGLTISQQYVRMMGGELELESAPGAGSTFRFRIDVDCGRPSGAPPHRPPITGVEPAAHGYRILVVDDQAEARLLVRSLLEPWGFQVVEAASATEALAAAVASPIHLVFMDWFLGDDNGLDLLGRMGQLPLARPPALVMLTANALAESREAALAAGADDFLSKPYEENDLCSLLERHLDVRFLRTPAPGPQDHAGGSRRPIAAADLATLSPATRSRLAAAALSLDPTRIASSVAAVALENPPLADRLGEFSHTRQYQALWQVLGILDPED